jgi:hypothetical protein
VTADALPVMEQSEEQFRELHFESTERLRSEYLRRVASVRRRTVESVSAEIDEHVATVGSRHRTRYLFVPQETLLYTLPVAAALIREAELNAVLLARGTEPYYRSLEALARTFDLGISERLTYLPIFRRTDSGGALLPQSLVACLTEQERARAVSADEWLQLRGLIENDVTYGSQLGASLRSVHDRHGTLAEAIEAVADQGIDERFLKLSERARALRFTDYLDLERINDGEWSVEEMVRALVEPIEDLAALQPGDREQIQQAVSLLSGGEQTIRACDRDLLLHYVRLHLFVSEAAALRGELKHAARPILNVLLRDTELGTTLRSRPVLCVDETVNSGSAFLLAEMVVRAFAGDVGDVEAHVITAITPALGRLLANAGLVDSFACDSLWSQEDVNEFYEGFYALESDGVRRYRKYRDVALILNPRRTTISAEGIAELNSAAACAACDLPELAFVGQFANWRYPSDVVKRELLKSAIRSFNEDALTRQVQNLIAHDVTKTFTCVSDELCVDLLVRDRMGGLRSALSTTRLPKRLLDLEERFGGADQAETLRQWASAGVERAADLEAAASAFAAGPAGREASRFLAGEGSFEKVVDAFYGS